MRKLTSLATAMAILALALPMQASAADTATKPMTKTEAPKSRRHDGPKAKVVTRQEEEALRQAPPSSAAGDASSGIAPAGDAHEASPPCAHKTHKRCEHVKRHIASHVVPNS